MRTYFSDLQIGSQILMPIVIVSASPRKTKALKPYLTLEIFDGRDKLQANYWDWAGTAIPSLNDTVYTIVGSVSEYNGQKQVTISAIRTNNEESLSDFQPSSGQDVNEVYKDAWQFVSDNVVDDMLRDLTLSALGLYKDAWLTIPAATGVHHAFVGGTLIHSLSVAKKSFTIASSVPEAHKDLCLVGGMLHDIGKLSAYGLTGATIIMTDIGKLHEHAHLGANMITSLTDAVTMKCYDDFLKLDLLKHIILSHHGELEHGAVITPQCIEAHIVHTADKIDAACQMIKEASDKTEEFWTDKVWALNSRQMINYKSIKALVPMTYDDQALPIVEANDEVSTQ